MPEMPPTALIELFQLFEGAGIEVWLDGGWAVDAALGRQTRPHRDLDVILLATEIPTLVDLLTSRDFEIEQGGTANFVLSNGSELEVDVHAVAFDAEGNGVFRMENGSDWILPAEGFKWRGVVEGMSIRCLSPEAQVLCHSNGYDPKENDFRDMELLQARFGVSLPAHLTRPTT